MLYRVHLTWVRLDLTTLVVIGIDCTGSLKSNYHRSRSRRPLFYNDHNNNNMSDYIDNYTEAQGLGASEIFFIIQLPTQSSTWQIYQIEMESSLSPTKHGIFLSLSSEYEEL